MGASFVMSVFLSWSPGSTGGRCVLVAVGATAGRKGNGRREPQIPQMAQIRRPALWCRAEGGCAAYTGWKPVLPRTGTAWAGGQLLPHEKRRTATVPKPFGPGWRPLRGLATGGDRCPRPTERRRPGDGAPTGGCAAYTGWKPVLPRTGTPGGDRCPRPRERRRPVDGAPTGGCAAYTGWKPVLPRTAGGGG